MRFKTIISAVLCLLATACSPTGATPDDGDKPWSWGSKDDGPQQVGSSFYPKKDGSFRIMVYNVGVFSKYMDNSTDMVAAMIKEVEADVVALNELDSVNTRHRINQAAALASALGSWQWRYGRTMAYREGAYGNGVVLPPSSKILDHYVVSLTRMGDYEPRGLCVVETKDYVIASCHVDHSSDEYALSQMNEIIKWANSRYKDYDKPVFFCGDMNSVPDSEAIAKLKGAFDLISSAEPSVPVSGPTRCIDYIFHYRGSKAVKVIGSNTMTKFTNGDVTKASDHCPVYVDVKL